ncbi:MAG TPA: EthD family reductase [candidate division Zixibacteria bacterium]|nr:EthD family reductase [candidate division Zixibacteria bacterium]
MTARLIVLYHAPEDTEAFDAHYRDVHTPIVQRYPNLRELRVTRAAGVGGREPPFYVMAEMVFDTRADLDAALSSEAGTESARDLRNFASGGVTMFIADDESGAL